MSAILNLDSQSNPPAIFDGTTRLYISTICPYAQRVWIARNYKNLEQIELIGINLQDRPDWYREKVYPPNKDMDSIDAYTKTKLSPEINLKAYKWHHAKDLVLGTE